MPMNLAEATAQALTLVEEAMRKPRDPADLADPLMCRYSERPGEAPCRGRGFCPQDPACNE